MDAYELLMTRRSIRRYTEQEADEGTIRKILEAGMAAPTAANTRDWSFIVVTDRELLNRMADGNGRAATPLRNAAFGILVCGDLAKALPQAQAYWVIDCALAAENMTLAATALGLGSVLIGTWPQEEKVSSQRALFDLPETIIPHTIIAFGYPEDPSLLEHGREDRVIYQEDRIHFNKW